ncbi:hypothetical protein H5J25_08340 [Sphingomonas aliaeris]|uniref:Uncharacterized protein n=1 Tax=Sphingomonas aliaeris TaxID=2759526 RepID=A0A974NXC9_9SPHN|nr:hypothetical protein [Sphingomonas aliaeris]QQV78603.1 hypothetical protein H5J25_08340 [Sphingomonas aliaeris]
MLFSDRRVPGNRSSRRFTRIVVENALSVSPSATSNVAFSPAEKTDTRSDARNTDEILDAGATKPRPTERQREIADRNLLSACSHIRQRIPVAQRQQARSAYGRFQPRRFLPDHRDGQRRQPVIRLVRIRRPPQHKRKYSQD